MLKTKSSRIVVISKSLIFIDIFRLTFLYAVCIIRKSESKPSPIRLAKNRVCGTITHFKSLYVRNYL